MKPALALFVFMAISSFASAQEKSREMEKENDENNAGTSKRGYIGVSLGPSFPIGEFAKKSSFPPGSGLTGPETTSTGLQLNLINLGYLFTKHFGIAGSWFGAAYLRSSNRGYELDPWSCGGIMAGPLFSYPISEKVEWDFRPMIGYSVCSGNPENTTYEPPESSVALLLNVGTVFRIHTSKNGRGSLLLTADYFSTKLKYKNLGVTSPYATEQAFKALTLGLGFALRLK